MKAEITIVFPVFNEAETIEYVISEFYREIEKKVPLEIVVAEDGSTDDTKKILLRFGEKIPMKLILGEKRKGYSEGLIGGLSKVDTRHVVFVDSDGQHLAKDFWKLYELRDKFDVISGRRVSRADATYRRMMSVMFQLMVRTLFRLPSLHDPTAPYKLMRSEVAKEVACECQFMKESFWTEFIIRAHNKGLKIAEVPVTHRRRPHGTTNVYNIWKIPRIALSQIKGLFKLWKELKRA